MPQGTTQVTTLAWILSVISFIYLNRKEHLGVGGGTVWGSFGQNLTARRLHLFCESVHFFIPYMIQSIYIFSIHWLQHTQFVPACKRFYNIIYLRILWWKDISFACIWIILVSHICSNTLHITYTYTQIPIQTISKCPLLNIKCWAKTKRNYRDFSKLAS